MGPPTTTTPPPLTTTRTKTTTTRTSHQRWQTRPRRASPPHRRREAKPRPRATSPSTSTPPPQEAQGCQPGIKVLLDDQQEGIHRQPLVEGGQKLHRRGLPRRWGASKERGAQHHPRRRGKGSPGRVEAPREALHPYASNGAVDPRGFCAVHWVL